MKVAYRGIQKELPPKLQEKLDAKFAKLSKMLERKGEKEAHVIITTERHLHKSEITVQFYDHQLVGVGADADLFTSMSQALDKLEKQAVKQRTKWREKKRHSNGEAEAEESSAEEPAGEGAAQTRSEVRVFPVNHHSRRKPMTLEEALFELEHDESRNYLVYRDAEKECVSVLVRRKDGHFDLIES
jgi:putative sigma-54 modulation protein